MKNKMKEKKEYKFNKGRLFVYFLIGVPFVALWAVGGFYIKSGALGTTYYLSSILIFLGLIWVFKALGYQRQQYTNNLKEKYSKLKEKNNIAKNEKVTVSCNTEIRKPCKIHLCIREVKDFFLKYRVFPTQSQCFFGLLIIGVIVCLIPYQNWNGVNGFLDVITIFRKTMQMFVVDGGVNDFIDYCKYNTPFFFQDVSDTGLLLYNIYVALLCVAAGLIFTFKIVFIFAKEFKAYFDYWWAHPYSDIYVMSELNEQSIILAESICSAYPLQGVIKIDIKNKKNDFGFANYFRIYFCDAYSDNRERSSELILRAKRLGAVVMKKDIADIKIKKCCRSNKFYLIGNSEEENVEQAQRICNSSEANNATKELDIYIYASRQESEFIIDNMHGEKENGNEKQSAGQSE